MTRLSNVLLAFVLPCVVLHWRLFSLGLTRTRFMRERRFVVVDVDVDVDVEFSQIQKYYYC